MLNIYEELKSYILSEGINSSIKKYGDKVSPEFIQWVSKYDPSPTKKYVEWMVNRFIKEADYYLGDDIEKIISLSKDIAKNMDNEFARKWIFWREHFDFEHNWLYNYDRLVRNKIISGKDANIYNFDNIGELKSIIEKGRNKEEENWIKKIPASKKYKYKDANIFYVEKKEQAIKYGYHTHWCISGINDNQFNKYNQFNYIFIVIIRNEKFALLVDRDYDDFVASENPFILYNEMDDSIDENKLFSKVPSSVFINILNKEKSNGHI